MMIEKLGPYRIGRLLGRGGMGEVYEGQHEQTGERAAVKVLAPAMARSEGFRERFEAEIESLKQLRHPNIVELLGYGEDQGLLFYSMELIDGRSLEEELCNERRFSWREVTSIGIQLCRALKHAHDHGIIHRDLKPANILLTADDQIKLLDFGIARLFGGHQVTNAGGVLGTADYMSPEQADGRPVSDRCDQYSLGCVLYALATGGPPFHSTSLPKLLQMQRFARPEPLRKFAPDMPEELERIVAQLLEKDSEKRYPSVLVVARQLSAMERALTRPVEEPSPGSPTLGSSAQPASDAWAATRVPEPSTPPPPSPDITQEIAPAAPLLASEPPALPSAPSREPASRFTSVEEELARERQEQSDSWLSLLAPLGLLMLVVAAAGAGVWWLWQPRSADALYAEIEQAAADERPEQLRTVEAEVDEFLQRFPDDPRAEQVARYQDQLELRRAERRLRLFSRHAGPESGLTPLERMYVDAVRQAELHPERAIAQLSALLTLFEDHESLNESERQSLVLARRQLARLEQQMAAQAEEHLALLRERLEYAQQMQATNPEQAGQIWRAIIELYEDKPWAAEPVQQAKEQLAENAAEEPGAAVSVP